MTPPAKKPAAPKAPTDPSIRPVAYVLFRRPVALPGFGRRMLELTAGAEYDPPPGRGDLPKIRCPRMMVELDTETLVIGKRRFALAGACVESYELGTIATGSPTE